MRTMKLYRHGLTMGTAPGKNDHERAKRGNVIGWSASTTRTNTRFLRSVDEKLLPTCSAGRPLLGFAFTGTIRDCPPSHEDWVQLKDLFIRRLRRMGLYRMHWLTEWQRRGVPHLHAAFWLPRPKDDREYFRLCRLITNHWLEVASEYGASRLGQKVLTINDAVGWFKYLSKHASRGISHYQRSPELVPKGWEKTGRMWGKVGHWPEDDAIHLQISDELFYRLRRAVRRWRIADARAEGSRKRLVSARTMLKDSEPARGAVRGVSEWISQESMLRILDSARANSANSEVEN